jgi:CRISPR-associated endonuclease/helicase Cas3
MVPVIVPGDDIAREAVRELSFENVPTGKLARVLQSYTVAVPPRVRAMLMDQRYQRVKFVAPEIRGDAFAVLVDPQLYQRDIGLLWEDPEYVDADTLMV